MEDIIKFIIEKIDFFDSERYNMSIKRNEIVLTFETEGEFFDIYLPDDRNCMDDVFLLTNIILRYLIFEKEKIYILHIDEEYNEIYFYFKEANAIEKEKILNYEESYKTLSK